MFEDSPLSGNNLSAGSRSTGAKPAIGIGFKLALLLSFFAVLASGFTGYYAYAHSRSLLIESAENELMTSTQVLGRRFSILMAEVVRNLQLLTSMPAARSVLEGGREPFDRRIPEDNLAEVFSSMLALNQQYFQIRLIGLANNGLELVRVDRDAGQLSRVEGEQLQEKAQYPYVYKTQRLKPGQIFQSEIVINHELGAHQGVGKPTMQFATPIASKTGETQGLVVINVDLDGLFDLLQKDLPKNISLYLTNEQGDFLIHPDQTQEFGFDRGRRILMQEDFPQTGGLFEEETDHLVLQLPAPSVVSPGRAKGTLTGANMMAAFMTLPFGDYAPERFVVLGLSLPMRSVLAGTQSLAWNIVKIVIGFSLLAIIVAVVTSRAVTKPLQNMVAALQQFSSDHVRHVLPVLKNDEFGMLARSFNEMQHLLKNHLDTLHEKEMHLQFMVQHDALTNLPNRLMLFDRLQHAIERARRGSKQVALIFIDLDRFKDINDSMGHAAGDKVIKFAALRLGHFLRSGDTVARLGGDEFVIVLEEIENTQQVAVIVLKLLQELQQPIRLENRDLYLSASMGISLFPSDGDDAETLLRNADSAMYRSKADGRNTFHFYTEDLTVGALSRVQLESDMRQALAYKGFVPYYQPQIDLQTGTISGLEALVRWRHSDGSLRMPGDFIALAEDTGLIESIGEMVLEAACRQMKIWRDVGLQPGRVAVNLSGKQLRRQDLPQRIAAILHETGCLPEWLSLEVTESSFLDRPEQAIAILNQLKSSGIELAIDDFGTGYSSLTYLKNLPVAKLKIDRSFVCHLPDDEDDVAITRAVIAMAKSLALQVIAEGVETEAQLCFVTNEGCDEAQGFYYSPAVAADAMTALLQGAGSFSPARWRPECAAAVPVPRQGQP
jgi:diguanylate cyclase (GGDEF)-like protein